jgi:hypothetical protein
MDEGSMIVKSSVPLLTTSPALTLRFDTMPWNGARITVSPRARSALARPGLRISDLRFGRGHGVVHDVEVAGGECAGTDQLLGPLGLAARHIQLILRRPHG